MLNLERVEGGVILPIQAHAGSRRNSLLGTRAGSLRVAVTSAPEKGKANRAIIVLLSKALEISKSSFEIISGDTSPKKRVLVRGIEFQHLQQRFDEILPRKDS